MPRLLENKSASIFILCLLFLGLSFLIPPSASAAICGSKSQTIVTSCFFDRLTNVCTAGTTNVDRDCRDDNVGHAGSCTALQVTYYCDSNCKRQQDPDVYVSCSGGGGGGGGNCNHTYSCAQSGSAPMSKCCPGGGNCCGTISSGPNRGQPKKCRDNGCIPQPPACTAPVIIQLSRVSSTSLSVSWVPGAQSTSQTVYIGANKTEVTNNCPGTGSPACVVKATSLAPTTTTYTTANVLVPGTVYYVKVVNAGSCNLSSGISNHLSSCLVSPASAQIKVGATQAITTSVNSSTDITQVAYSSSNSSVVSVSPASDTTYVYGTTLTGNSPGSGTITSDVYFGSTLACTNTSAITVVPSGPWWQTKDTDVYSAGDLTSDIPTAGTRFDLDGPGTFPGVPIYNGSADFLAGNGVGTVSSKNWLANTSALPSKVYNSGFFINQIPSDVVLTDVGSSSPDGTFFESGGTLSHGYYWYKYDGNTTGLDLTLNSSMNLGTRKVILLVENANFNISGNINVTDGSGFFMAIAGKNADGRKGNIFVSSTVGGGATPNLEGIYLADGVFRTGTTGATNDSKLYIRGSVTGYDGVNLDRDLGPTTNGTTPAEFFEYAPDQIMLFPKELSVRRISWKEVAP